MTSNCKLKSLVSTKHALAAIEKTEELFLQLIFFRLSILTHKTIIILTKSGPMSRFSTS